MVRSVERGRGGDAAGIGQCRAWTALEVASGRLGAMGRMKPIDGWTEAGDELVQLRGAAG